MTDAVSETKACDLLARLFKSRGYAVSRNVMFREYGVEFHADGWDPRARVGFEFLSSEDEDHDDLTLAEYQTLMAAQKRGELSLFIIDEVEPLSAADLLRAATDFLDEVAAAKVRRVSRSPQPARKGRAAKQPTARPSGVKPATSAGQRAAKPAAKKAAVKKLAAKKSAAKTTAQKKTATPKTPARAVAKQRQAVRGGRRA
ncbi:MAG: hypothetical protein LW698_04370 [Planctomycetaceae bacterium]|jgi:hypothetical protein|nr:hypothetical protein [Planctomycetaceae bacterium]